MSAPGAGFVPRAGAYFDFECFLLKNGALYFITQQKKSFFSEIFNVVRLMDEKQTKYAPALGLSRGSSGQGKWGGESQIKWRAQRVPPLEFVGVESLTITLKST